MRKKIKIVQGNLYNEQVVQFYNLLEKLGVNQDRTFSEYIYVHGTAIRGILSSKQIVGSIYCLTSTEQLVFITLIGKLDVKVTFALYRFLATTRKK